jgi:predicted phage-related endonuclease
MNIQKRLNKLKDILDADRQAQLEKYKSLKKVLKSLRTEKKGLEERLSDTTDEEQRQELSSRLKVISMQRKKGLRLLKELKEERKQGK